MCVLSKHSPIYNISLSLSLSRTVTYVDDQPNTPPWSNLLSIPFHRINTTRTFDTCCLYPHLTIHPFCMFTEKHSVFTRPDCSLWPPYLCFACYLNFGTPVRLIHSPSCSHHTLPTMNNFHSFTVVKHTRPQYTTSNNSPSSFVCSTQLCITVFSVPFVKSRPLLSTP